MKSTFERTWFPHVNTVWYVGPVLMIHLCLGVLRFDVAVAVRVVVIDIVMKRRLIDSDHHQIISAEYTRGEGSDRTHVRSVSIASTTAFVRSLFTMRRDLGGRRGVALSSLRRVS